jgi:quercetin dioxygenase-like cupin family protein
MSLMIQLAEPLRHVLAASAPAPADVYHQRLVGGEAFAGARGMLAAHWLPAGTGITDSATAEQAVCLLAGSGLRLTGAGHYQAMTPGAAIYYPPGATRVLRAPARHGALFLEVSAASGPARPHRLVHGDRADEGHPAGAVADDGTGPLGTGGGAGARWLVDETAAGAVNLSLATSVFVPGGSHELHRHRGADEFFLVLSGGGEHLTASAPLRVGGGELVYIPAGEWHSFRTYPKVITQALYGFLCAPSLKAAGYELLGPAVSPPSNA